MGTAPGRSALSCSASASARRQDVHARSLTRSTRDNPVRARHHGRPARFPRPPREREGAAHLRGRPAGAPFESSSSRPAGAARRPGSPSETGTSGSSTRTRTPTRARVKLPLSRRPQRDGDPLPVRRDELRKPRRPARRQPLRHDRGRTGSSLRGRAARHVGRGAGLPDRGGLVADEVANLDAVVARRRGRRSARRAGAVLPPDARPRHARRKVATLSLPNVAKEDIVGRQVVCLLSGDEAIVLAARSHGHGAVLIVPTKTSRTGPRSHRAPMGPLRVILLPGIVTPAEIAYGAFMGTFHRALRLLRRISRSTRRRSRRGYTLDVEAEACCARQTHAAEQFHLVGYSGGGAAALAVAATHPERLTSLALLEPAWAGNWDVRPAEASLRREFGRLQDLAPNSCRRSRASTSSQVSHYRRRRRRPAALDGATAGRDPRNRQCVPEGTIDREALRHFDRPVYFALGALSNPDLYGEIEKRLSSVFRTTSSKCSTPSLRSAPPRRARAPGELARSTLAARRNRLLVPRPTRPVSLSSSAVNHQTGME